MNRASDATIRAEDRVTSAVVGLGGCRLVLSPAASACRRSPDGRATTETMIAPTWPLHQRAPAGCPRHHLERFIHRCFAEAHGADIDSFMPYLLGIVDHDDVPLAAVGLRPAALEGLFLEQYLERPIEAGITDLAGRPTARHEIVEVGNLATDRPGMARQVIIAMTFILRAAGYEWVAFTVTPRLRNSFARLGLYPIEIAAAAGERLGPLKARWGRYYDDGPVVVAGRPRDALDRLAGDPRVHAWFRRLIGIDFAAEAVPA